MQYNGGIQGGQTKIAFISYYNSIDACHSQPSLKSNLSSVMMPKYGEKSVLKYAIEYEFDLNFH